MRHIRLATEEDLPVLVRMSESFFKASPYKIMRFDKKKTETTLRALMGRGLKEGVVLVALHEDKLVGFLAGLADSPAFSNQMISMELAWWVDEAHRGSRGSLLLYSAYEDWAKRVGCTHCQGAYLPGVSPDLERFYTKRGYVKTEESYVKVLKI